MVEAETHILESVKKIIPELTEQDKARLEAFVQGLAFQLEDRGDQKRNLQEKSAPGV